MNDGRASLAEAGAIDRTQAVQIVTLCTECGVPQLAAGFLERGASLDDVKTQVSKVGAVMQMSATARRIQPGIPADLATKMLAEGYGIAEIRAELLNRIVAEEDKTSISSHIPESIAGSAGIAAAETSMLRVLKASGITPVERSRP